MNPFQHPPPTAYGWRHQLASENILELQHVPKDARILYECEQACFSIGPDRPAEPALPPLDAYGVVGCRYVVCQRDYWPNNRGMTAHMVFF